MLQVSLNFGGFYGSIHDSNVDGMLESYFDYEDFNSDTVNYRLIYIEYLKKYIEFLNSLMDTELKFMELVSPREYNFHTDIIEVLIHRSDILRVFDYIKENDLKSDVLERIKDATTSRPGYIPFFNYEDIFKKENRDKLLECIFDVICHDEENLFMDYYDFHNVYELLHSSDFIKKA